MRIVGGEFRGRALTPVGKGDQAAHLRPTTDRTRETIFNILAGGRFDVDVVNAQVLDLFAGTGALGLEALSRGAAHVVLVENGRAGQRLIRSNIEMLGVSDRTRLLSCDARKLPAAPHMVDLVFMDPPYGKALATPVLATAHKQGWLSPKTLIVLEENAPAELPGFESLDHRKLGSTWLSFLKPN